MYFSRDIDIENNHMDTKLGMDGWGELYILAYTHCCV